MKYEVHTHSFVSGPRAVGHYERGVWFEGTFSHSHDGGDRPHQHPDTGPATYTIDKDEWARRTGGIGGGRKQFTAKPTGEQLPIVELEDWQKSFRVIVVGDYDPRLGNGPGIALPERIAQQFKMTYTVHDGRKRRA